MILLAFYLTANNNAIVYIPLLQQKKNNQNSTDLTGFSMDIVICELKALKILGAHQADLDDLASEHSYS